MATTQNEIRKWFDTGVSNQAKWMIIVCDTFNYEDYAVYADTVKEFDSKYNDFNGRDYSRIMEVYDLSKPREPQVTKARSWEYPIDSRFNPVKPEDPVKAWLNAR